MKNKIFLLSLCFYSVCFAGNDHFFLQISGCFSQKLLDQEIASNIIDNSSHILVKQSQLLHLLVFFGLIESPNPGAKKLSSSSNMNVSPYCDQSVAYIPIIDLKPYLDKTSKNKQINHADTNFPLPKSVSKIPIFGAGFCAGAASSLFIFALLYATNSYQNNNYYHAHSSWNLFDFLRFR